MNIVDDLQRNLSLADYNDAMKRFIELCHKCGITDDRIAFFGSVSCPGVSDLDVAILSSSKNIKKLINLLDKERQQSGSFRYIFWHPPVYILDDLLRYAKYLHTLENLQPLVPESFFNSSSLHIDEQDKEILNVSWFCFLINNFLNIKMKANKGEIISLRLILLVYKNLFHSYLSFTDDLLKIDVIPPHEMRLKLLHNGLDGNKNDLCKNFCELFNNTLKRFDEFCINKLSFIANKEKISSSILTSSGVWRCSSRTSIHSGKLISTIYINELAFLFMRDYVYNTQHISQSHNYIECTKICEKAYSKVGINFQFIKPISVPNFFLKILINIASRINIE